MSELTGSRLLLVAALALMPLRSLAAADPCKGKAEGNGEAKGVVIGARTKVRVVVDEVSGPRKNAKLTLENSVGEPPLDLTAARKGMDRSYPGPVQLHLCAREFHAQETCFNKATYRPGVVELRTTLGHRVKLRVSCK